MNLANDITHFITDLRIRPKRFQLGAAMALYLSFNARKHTALHL